MKTIYIKNRSFLIKISVFLLILFSDFTLQAQVDEDVQDSTKTGYSTGQIVIPNPPSVVDLYIYDAITDRYVFTSSVVSGISITDLNGRVVKQISYTNVSDIQVNVSDLASGMYMMNITSDKGSVTKKILKN